jgi:hypothetical protein
MFSGSDNPEVTRKSGNEQTCLMAVIIVGCFLSVRVSAVPNFIPRDIVTRKGILLTNMMSMHSVTFLYRSIIVRGTSCCSNTTCCPPRRTCFPLNDCTLVPNMSSVAIMSSVVTGQFFSKFSFTMCSRSAVDLCPMVFCSRLATNTRW